MRDPRRRELVTGALGVSRQRLTIGDRRRSATRCLLAADVAYAPLEIELAGRLGRGPLRRVPVDRQEIRAGCEDVVDLFAARDLRGAVAARAREHEDVASLLRAHTRG